MKKLVTYNFDDDDITIVRGLKDSWGLIVLPFTTVKRENVEAKRSDDISSEEISYRALNKIINGSEFTEQEFYLANDFIRDMVSRALAKHTGSPNPISQIVRKNCQVVLEHADAAWDTFRSFQRGS
jgi:hypothetical protein